MLACSLVRSALASASVRPISASVLAIAGRPNLTNSAVFPPPVSVLASSRTVHCIMPALVVRHQSGRSAMARQATRPRFLPLPSTTALILATTLAELGASVALPDCDGNQPLARWKAGATRSRVKVLSAVSEREVLPVIDRERASTGLVVIDVEGAATRLTSRA